MHGERDRDNRPEQSKSPLDEDRRLHHRHVDPPVWVSGPSVVVKDVGLGGISLECEHTARPGDRYELILTDAVFHYTESLEAEVTWCTPDALGLRWIDLTTRQWDWLVTRLDHWIANRQHLVVSRTVRREK